jgi:hypothetical protein
MMRNPSMFLPWAHNSWRSEDRITYQSRGPDKKVLGSGSVLLGLEPSGPAGADSSQRCGLKDRVFAP